MDFAEYVAVRRPALVRSAVLLGCTVDDAEDLVQVALAKTLTHWRRVWSAERPDAYFGLTGGREVPLGRPVNLTIRA